MADNRYGGYGRRESWRERGTSIFSDDDDRRGRGSDRWSGDYGRDRGGSDDDRGFFERAGDEVRSWFGDEEAEQRRERDMRRDDARSAFGGDEPGYEGSWGGGASGLRGDDFTSRASESRTRSDWGRGDFGRERGGGFGGSQGDIRGTGSRSRQGFGGGSQWDDYYRQWRDQQIRQLDQEYDEFCRERQQRFEQDFDSWRTSRLTEGGSTGGTTLETGGGSATGFTGGTGTSTGAATETGSTTGSGETGNRGRGTRART